LGIKEKRQETKVAGKKGKIKENENMGIKIGKGRKHCN
jgi:hypothetical protein